ncbi:Uncharacterised protein [uncultured archaeon]|nr:Uncharacterised protein [uncultured archaeon]
MWSLYTKDKKFLEPLRFSNGKSQEEIVKEVLESIEQGNKVIFIHGVCGTGKSAIALNIARKLGRTSIVVPGKNLQNQYKADYEESKYLLKENKEKLKIRVITGRNNHVCKFLEDNKQAIPLIRKEDNSKLNDIFEGRRERVNDLIGKDRSADNLHIPCKIEIKERNWQRILEYLKQNNRINWKDFTEIKDVKRFSIAPVCPYWSPVMPSKYELKFSGNLLKKNYMGSNGSEFIFYQRKIGCPFYDQFMSYVDADVIVFNSQKYKIEFAIGRKPKTEVEIIDECDEFLDSFSNQRTINLDKLQNSLIHIIEASPEAEERLYRVSKIVKEIKDDQMIHDALAGGKILSLKETPLLGLVKIFLESSFLGEIDEESYLFDVEETAKIFEDVLEETYLIVERGEKGFVMNLVTTNLAKKFADLMNKNKILVLMSGTLHSDRVLKEVFGIPNYKIVEAESQQQGTIEVVKTGFEIDCKYDNFSKGKLGRKEYLIALEKCVDAAKKPVLVHVNAFQDLPTEKEISDFGLKNILSRERIIAMQEEDKEGRIVDEFKNGNTEVLFTTRCTRGVDFPGEQCNSIIFTKYPNPNVQDAFWKILKQTKPDHYWDFYKDKAKRELMQRIYRGLRFKEDHVYLLSPDTRVLEVFEKNL